MQLTEENYYSKEANLEYMSESLFKDFAGTYGRRGCEFCALEKMEGRWREKPSDPMLIGSYVDAYVDGPEAFEHFQNGHPEMFRADGSLYSKYRVADTVIKRITRDAYFMATLSGEKQKIVTGELFGRKWKGKLDSYLPHEAIVDLKVVRSINDTTWVPDLGHLDFIRYWGYDIQGAVYQELVRQETGEKLPFFVAAVSKEEYPDIEVIRVQQPVLDEAMTKVWQYMPRINSIINRETEPARCEECNCCKNSKVLTRWTDIDQLLPAV